MRNIFTKLWCLVAAMALVAACTTSKDEPTPNDPTPTPTEKGDFEVTIDDVTRATVTLSITPSEAIGDYICVVEERSVVEQYTQDKFVIATVFQELTEKASSKGLTLAEYMPSVVDNGKIEGIII